MASANDITRVYMSKPPKERLRMAEQALIQMVKRLSGEEEGTEDIKIPIAAVLLDVVREIRQLSGDHSNGSSNGSVESSAPESPEVNKWAPEVIEMEI